MGGFKARDLFLSVVVLLFVLVSNIVANFNFGCTARCNEAADAERRISVTIVSPFIAVVILITVHVEHRLKTKRVVLLQCFLPHAVQVAASNVVLVVVWVLGSVANRAIAAVGLLGCGWMMVVVVPVIEIVTGIQRRCVLWSALPIFLGIVSVGHTVPTHLLFAANGFLIAVAAALLFVVVPVRRYGSGGMDVDFFPVDFPGKPTVIVFIKRF